MHFRSMPTRPVPVSQINALGDDHTHGTKALGFPVQLLKNHGQNRKIQDDKGVKLRQSICEPVRRAKAFPAP